jgi:hypothetical protein
MRWEPYDPSWLVALARVFVVRGPFRGNRDVAIALLRFGPSDCIATPPINGTLFETAWLPRL